ncbi:MAG: restriction endonuclease [Chlorobi bacterium]|nr:restriction endonuclease [Chlorobiota bacterium]
MASAIGEKAIEAALSTGKAILKFVSRNDVGLTGGHQSGFFLPKSGWHIYSPYPPTKGENKKSWPRVVWQDGRITESCVTWYGTGTRSEYRLTKFGKGFPFLTADIVGDLLVLIPINHQEFRAYILDIDEDIEEIQVALSVEITETYAIYDRGQVAIPESEDECIARNFRKFVELLSDYPSTQEFADATRKTLEGCIKSFEKLTADERLRCLVDEEYTLFRMAERKITQPEVTRLFKDVDDFLATASTIMNRRKSRAGKSLERHVENLFSSAGIPFDAQPKIDGNVQPDILIPSRIAYVDDSYPADKLFVVGVKRTCKDRWRQVLNEAKRIPHKHILTLQPGISASQLYEMKNSNISLIVPKYLHKQYPRGTGISILTVEDFIAHIQAVHS